MDHQETKKKCQYCYFGTIQSRVCTNCRDLDKWEPIKYNYDQIKIGSIVLGWNDGYKNKKILGVLKQKTEPGKQAYAYFITRSSNKNTGIWVQHIETIDKSCKTCQNDLTSEPNICCNCDTSFSKWKTREEKKPIDKGDKYLRPIIGAKNGKIDIYAVAHTFNLTAGLYHAIKKILCAGERGIKSQVQDLEEAITALQREIEILKSKG